MIIQENTRKIALLDATQFLNANRSLFVVKDVHAKVGTGKYDTILKIVRGKRGKRMNKFARRVLSIAIIVVLNTAKEKKYITRELREDGEQLLEALKA